MTMSAAEVGVWRAYRVKNGPLSPIRMYDQGFALLASLMWNLNVKGKQKSPQDFMLYGEKHNHDFDEDPEELFNRMKRSSNVEIVR